MERPHAGSRSGKHRGVAAVEFALIASIFFTMVLGAAELGRILWVWNAAAEATRLGARVAAVCDKNAARIKADMQQRLNALGTGNIALTYLPASCVATCPAAPASCVGVTLCESVTVTLTGYTPQTFVPFANFHPAFPEFRTTLSREYMASASNPACQ